MPQKNVFIWCPTQNSPVLLYKNMTEVKLLVFLRPQTMLLKNTVFFFHAVPSGYVHLLPSFWKYIKLRVIFLSDVCIVLSPLQLSK